MNGNLGPASYQGYLNKNIITIAEGLKLQGYTTLMSGKWHVGNTPEQWPGARGYDKYFALIGGTGHQFYPHPYKLGEMDFFVENGRSSRTIQLRKNRKATSLPMSLLSMRYAF